MGLDEVLRFSIEGSVVELIKELTELGISICIAISAYKWFNLINPSEPLEAIDKQEFCFIKETAEKAFKTHK